MTKFMRNIAKSKTMIFSSLLAIAGVLEASTGFLQTVMSPSAFGYLMLAVGIISAVLRVYTTKPLSEK